MKKISIGFSTCPNDTFIFDALINQKIDSEGWVFEPYLADVEELNRLALDKQLDVTKLSYHAYGHVRNNYRILDAGSALGYGNGPLLIGRKMMQRTEILDSLIAIPGELTTANLLLGIAYPEAQNKIELLFSTIEEALISRQVDVGVIIHENRFTYQEKGLHLLEDLGSFWEKLTQMPIPLGGIAVNRALPAEMQQQIQTLIHNSLRFSLDHPDSPVAYMIQHAQELREDILQLHVKTFVNDFSLSLGEKGREAVKLLLHHGQQAGLFPVSTADIFV